MAEDRKVVPPVGRTRRFAGLVLIALGAVVSARAAWLGAFYGSAFRHVEWVRFGGLLWLGILMVLIGYWLMYRSRAAVAASAVMALAAFVMVYVHDRWLR